MARARVPRQRPASGPGALPITLALIAAGAVVTCFAATAFGFLGATVAREPKPIAPVIVLSPPEKKPVPTPSPEQRAGELRRLLQDEQRSAARVDRAVTETRAQIASLDARRVELEATLERRRADVLTAENSARRSEAQQKEAAERRRKLEEEAAELERRIAELNASIAEAEQLALARAAKESTGPQLVDCVRDAVILKPQQTRIPIALLNSGAFAAAVRRRGAHFVVRPDGFASFIAARGVARAAGTLVIAEPQAKE
ncbi:MAG TPA: hypothetical protein VFA04_24160 [Bryobacteraceae bacterium]|nr:hypothetical protein [Bryobacteraceae bacterium]